MLCLVAAKEISLVTHFFLLGNEGVFLGTVCLPPTPRSKETPLRKLRQVEVKGPEKARTL
jgi:hypothetical protein